MGMDKKKIAFNLSKLINRFPFNNSFKGKVRFNIKKSVILKTKFISSGKNNHIQIEDGCFLKNCIFYFGGNDNIIKIGKDVRAFDTIFHIEDDNNIIEIGNNTCFAGRAQLACIESTKIIVGKDCLFSSDIVLRTGDSHSILNLKDERVNYSTDINISDRVWVGYGVKINKGVLISSDSVVGTGSVVTNSFEKSNVIIAGVPAKIIKEDIKWTNKRN